MELLPTRLLFTFYFSLLIVHTQISSCVLLNLVTPQLLFFPAASFNCAYVFISYFEVLVSVLFLAVFIHLLLLVLSPYSLNPPSSPYSLPPVSLWFLSFILLFFVFVFCRFFLRTLIFFSPVFLQLSSFLLFFFLQMSFKKNCVFF